MHGKYAIEFKETEETKGMKMWIDFTLLGKVVYVKTFLHAHLFNTKEEAESIFDEYLKLKKEDHEVFGLEVFAKPLKWER